ncbi:MAG: energy transducer TonB [Chloracidobacterium sp.]|nr:energy transducer TonB [Chloracidobacterium sp.]
MKTFVIANVLFIWMVGAPQIGSFERRAISSAQEMSASDLDKALPDRPFASWFNDVVGQKAGVVWQLTECGEQISAQDKTGRDLPACAEINANMPDGRKVFVAISVGTFKKGLTGKPSFFRAVIEQNELFYQVRRLSELPKTLRSETLPSSAGMKNRIVDPPAIKMDSALIISPLHYLASPSLSVPPVTGDLSAEPPLAPPSPSTRTLEDIPESVSQSRALIKVKPAYPPTAKKMNATGPVEVEITISEKGLVIEATAISGHLALRSAAVEAARKWVFEPATTVNGEHVKVKSVLTFVFAASAK